MIVTIQLAIGNRVATEQITMPENLRGDLRKAVIEAASRLELGTYGPNAEQGCDFDEPLQTKMAL